MNLIRLYGSSALSGHCMVVVIPTHDGQDLAEHFVVSSRDIISFTGCRKFKPGDTLGTATAPFLCVPLEALATDDAQNEVIPVAESPMLSASPSLAINATPDTLDELTSELLRRLNDGQRESFLRLWNTVPSRMKRIDFALDAPGWDPGAIDALSATLIKHADIVSSSKLNYGACSLHHFKIKVPPGTRPIQSRSYRLNPVPSKQADAILDSYLAAGLIQHSTSSWSTPLVCVPNKSDGIPITLNYQKLNKVAKLLQITIPRVDKVLHTPGSGSLFYVFKL